MDFLQPAFVSAPNVKALINIGACLDIPTGTYVTGEHGEMILNGGLGNLTGVVGHGNNFKSTLMHYMVFKAMARMGMRSSGNSYDTEINIHESHLKNLIDNIEEFNGEDIILTGRWIITDKTVYHGDEWYDLFKEFLQEKRKNLKKHMRPSPFMNRERTACLDIPTPGFTEVDSMSEFVTQDVIKMQDENSLGEKGANTVSMRQGLQKNRFLMEIPALAGATNNYTAMTAHIGSEFNLDPNNPAPRKLQYLKGGMKLKGVPEKFTFVMNNCWHAYNSAPLLHKELKTPQYPRDASDSMKGDTDLSTVDLRQLRGKAGPSGMVLQLVVSQTDGVLPTMTEFLNCKNNKFGFGGNDQTYYLELYPEEKLGRTTVRRKFEADPMLCRAMNLTSEILQIVQYMYQHGELIADMNMKKLYDDIAAMGYDWKILLNTRGWWTLKDNYIGNLPPLSALDLLRIRAGQYHPYWLEDDKKTYKVMDETALVRTLAGAIDTAKSGKKAFKQPELVEA